MYAIFTYTKNLVLKFLKLCAGLLAFRVLNMFFYSLYVPQLKFYHSLFLLFLTWLLFYIWAKDKLKHTWETKIIRKPKIS